MSGIGKGITTSSIGVVLQMAGYKTTVIKIDPYLNQDSGTMSPFEHGECYVLDDGGETDLDLGNYERFLGLNLTRDHNITTGKIYQLVLNAERQGGYLGKTVQIIPHVTGLIERRIENTAEYNVEPDNNFAYPEICLIELGGTVGDFESLPFTEAIRRLRYRLGSSEVMIVNLTYLPVLEASQEIKTKPAQAGIQKLRELGIYPDLLCLRSSQKPDEETLAKLANFAQISRENLIVNQDVGNIYQIPIIFREQSILRIIQDQLHLRRTTINDRNWEAWTTKLVNPVLTATKKIGIIGKYTGNPDSYLSLTHAIKHACYHFKVKPEIQFIESDILDGDVLKQQCANLDAVVIPGGFGQRGIEGMIKGANICRTHQIPTLGICLGFQVMTIEYARNKLGLSEAHSTEFNPETPDPVIYLMPEQQLDNLGGTMRLGQEQILINSSSSLAYQLYQANQIRERHRHRYEVNLNYLSKFESAGLNFSGKDKELKRMEILELPTHRFYLGTQFHPEYLTRPLKPHPVFLGLIKATL